MYDSYIIRCLLSIRSIARFDTIRGVVLGIRALAITFSTVAGETAMMTKEENDLLTQTDLGTPMGELMRRYW